DLEDNLKNYLTKVEEFFKASYQQERTAGFYFRPQKFPTMGADPDTRRGDSGAPTFDLSRNALVGLLRGGAPDTGGDLPRGANFAYFEHVIPMSQVVAELDTAQEGW